MQQDLHGHRDSTNDPLRGVRRTLHSSRDLLTENQATRLEKLFAVEQHVAVEGTELGQLSYPGKVVLA